MQKLETMPNRTDKHQPIAVSSDKNTLGGKKLSINRVPDLNDIDTRIANGLKYPIGDFVCHECDDKNSDSWKLPK